MTSKKKNIYIVGGAGFLGKETVKILKKNNFNIIVADLALTKNFVSKEIPFIPLDITNLQSIDNLEIEKGDIVINLASRQYHNNVPYFKRKQWFENVKNLKSCKRLV